MQFFGIRLILVGFLAFSFRTVSAIFGVSRVSFIGTSDFSLWFWNLRAGGVVMSTVIDQVGFRKVKAEFQSLLRYIWWFSPLIQLCHYSDDGWVRMSSVLSASPTELQNSLQSKFLPQSMTISSRSPHRENCLNSREMIYLQFVSHLIKFDAVAVVVNQY